MNTLTACIMSFLFVDASGTAHMSAHEMTYNETTDRAMLLAAIDTGRTITREFGGIDVHSGFACEGGEWVDLGLDEELGNTIASYVGVNGETRHVELQIDQEKSLN